MGSLKLSFAVLRDLSDFDKAWAWVWFFEDGFNFSSRLFVWVDLHQSCLGFVFLCVQGTLLMIACSLRWWFSWGLLSCVRGQLHTKEVVQRDVFLQLMGCLLLSNSMRTKGRAVFPILFVYLYFDVHTQGQRLPIARHADRQKWCTYEYECLVFLLYIWMYSGPQRELLHISMFDIRSFRVYETSAASDVNLSFIVDLHASMQVNSFHCEQPEHSHSALN